LSRLQASITLAEERILAEIGLYTPFLGQRSASFVIENGLRGRFEVTAKVEEYSYGVALETSVDGEGRRKGRAAFQSPAFGNFDIELVTILQNLV
jgi:hypothetical protein